MEMWLKIIAIVNHKKPIQVSFEWMVGRSWMKNADIEYKYSRLDEKQDDNNTQSSTQKVLLNLPTLNSNKLNYFGRNTGLG